MKPSKLLVGSSALALTFVSAAGALVFYSVDAEGAAAVTSLTAYTTAYSYWDNTPPGSASISHPVLHSKAGGVGTFADPVTLAVGHSIVSGKDVLDYPKGTKFYFPDLRKYAIVEDSCGDGGTPQNGPCHSLTQAPKDAQVWLDVWADGKAGTSTQADKCMSKITDGNGALHTVVKDPGNNYVVEPKSIIEGSTCRANYGNALVTVTPSPEPTTPSPTPSVTPTPTPTPTASETLFRGCVPVKP